MSGFTLSLCFALAVAVVAVVKLAQAREIIRRDALLEGSAVLRRRAATKWKDNPNAAIEDENCALVLERMAGTLPTLEIQQEVAA
jgi:hypothetical protein